MTVQQLIDMLQGQGWRLTKAESDIRHFKHESAALTVTVSGKPELLVPRGVLRTLRRTIHIEDDSDALRSDL